MWRIWTSSRTRAAAAGLLLVAGSGAGWSQAPSSPPSEALNEDVEDARSTAELRVRANAGDADAQNELGARLLATEEPSAIIEAREWFRRASEAGDVDAMGNYAGMVLQGAGGEQDEAEGRRLLELAASRGSVGAHLTLAEAHLRGAAGYPTDAARALGYVRAAANLESPSASLAQWRLAMMYLRGVGTSADAVQAYRWVVRASENGSVRAMISRAVMLATGEGVEEDDVAAREWYQRAATSGDVNFAHALRGLGSMLVTGEGGAADIPRGIAYLRIAHAGNDANAATLLERWRDLITPEVDREAQRIANEWMAEHLPSDD